MKRKILIAVQLLKSRIGERAILFVLILLVSILFQLSVTLFTDFGNFFNRKATELHTPAFMIEIPDREYKSDYEIYISEHECTDELRKDEIIVIPGCTIEYGGEEISLNIVLIRDGSLKNDEIMVPVLFEFADGRGIGDIFAIEVGDTRHTFTIKDFFEDYYFGAVNFGILGVHVSETEYERAYENAQSATLLSVYVKPGTSADLLMSDFMRNVAPDGGRGFSALVWTYTFSQAKANRTLTSNIAAIVLLTIAVLLWVVVSVMIKHSVDEELFLQKKSFATLYYLGFTYSDIRRIVLLQYMFVCVPATIIGTVISPICVTPFRNAVSEQSGLIWDYAPRIINMLAGVAILLIIFWGSVRAISGRIKKMSAIDVIRGRDQSGLYYLRSSLKAKQSRNLYLAKAFRHINRKSFMSLYLIVALMTIASTLIGILFYNISIDRSAFVGMVIPEQFDLKVVAKTTEDAKVLYDDLSKMGDISEIVYYDTGLIQYQGMNLRTFISDTYDEKKDMICYEGKMPETENEILIGGRVAGLYGVKIEDQIEINLYDESATYTVCGYGQAANQAGMIAAMTSGGMSRLMQGEGYEYLSMDVTLRPDADGDALRREIENIYEDEVDTVVLFRDMMDIQMSSYLMLIRLIAIIMVVLAVVVIGFSVFLVINTILRKQFYHIGIEKMIGFTGKDMIVQNMLSYMIPCTLIVLISATLTSAFANRLFSGIFSGIGIIRSAFLINGGYVLLIGIILLLIIFLSSLISARKLKKVSVVEAVKSAE